MLTKTGLLEIEKTKIIAIVRGVERKDILRVTEALLRGGINVMEITLNTPDALSMIQLVHKEFHHELFLGAGTVIDLDDGQAAVQAGASFLVAPHTDKHVIHWAQSMGIPMFPGACTPTEIIKAYQAGATAVKIFPSASLGGLMYLKELMAPLEHIPMIAVGGVNESNIRQYLEIGCYCVGIGASLIHLTEIAKQNFEWITEKAKRLLDASC